MDAKFKEEWLKALRSGEYKQYRGAMTDSMLGTYKGATAYCCLGVGCLIKSGTAEKADAITGVIDTLELHNDYINKLIDLNDKQEKSFIEIADWIEKNVETSDAKET